MNPSPTQTRRRPSTETPADPDLAETPGWAPVPPAEPSPSPSPSTSPDGDVDGGYRPASTTAAASGSAGQDRTPASTLEKLSREGLSEAAEAGFRGLGEALNSATAEDDQDDVWEVRDREARGFGKAAGRILARKMPEVAAGNAADASDLIAVVVTAGVWAIRNLAEWLPRGRERWFPRAKGKHKRADPGDQAPGYTPSTATDV